MFRGCGPTAALGATEKQALLAANELFADITDEALAELQTMTRLSSCPAGQLLYEPGESGEVLFFLKRGHVHIYRLSLDGRKLIVGDIKSGSFFGEMTALGQGMAGNFAEAAEDSLVCAMSRTDVQNLLRRDPEIAARLIERLAQRLYEAEARLETLAYQRLDARLASVLLRERSPDDTVHGLTQQDLAEMVGASRETVSRALKELAGRKLLKPGRRQVRLLDVAALQALTATD